MRSGFLPDVPGADPPLRCRLSDKGGGMCRLGNSAAANLVQEAKNGREKCDIYIDGRSRNLRTKAAALQGYVKIFRSADDPAEAILSRHQLRKTEEQA